MITHLSGKLSEKNPTYVVIDCNGVGYFVNISLFTFSNLSSNETIKLYTHLQVREDAHTLYGFSSIAEREIFKLLISVSGIGAKTAQRVIIDLKDKILKIYDIDEVSVKESNTNKDQALSALEVLGFNKKQADKVLDKLAVAQPEASVEELIKQALKKL